VFVSIGVAWGVIGLVDRTQVTAPHDAALKRSLMPPVSAPLLQSDITAKEDIETLREEEEKKMNHTGWIEKEPGYAQIPVETAMKIVEERGLPTRPNAKEPEDNK
ncbi:MAG: hypothetical protein ABUL72_04775, partial [Armatimonadota bacterium]